MKATLRAAIDRLAGADLDHLSMRAEAAAILRRHLDVDVAVWATVDPVTVLWTHCLLDGMGRDHHLERRIFENEFAGDDVCSLPSLLTAGRPVDTIAAATGGEPNRSARFRELIAPLGMSDELRALFVDGDTPWGALHLLRAGRPFAPDEVAAVAAIGRPLAAGLRRALLTTAATQPGRLDDPPGLIELDRNGSIRAVGPEARALLDGADPDELPQVVAAVVAGREAGGPAVASLATPGGQWLSVAATSVGGRAAVIVEPIRPRRLADIVVRSHGLTAREREIVEHVARGASTRRIGRELGISEWTVQDHLKSIFAKFGVGSRAELVAAVFFGHYLPMHDDGATPSPRGYYLDDGGLDGSQEPGMAGRPARRAP